MSENQQSSTEQQQPVFNIEKIYVKDLSLEIPNSPQIFLERDQPQIEIKLNTETTGIDEGHYEVVLTITATATLQSKTVFLVEAGQAGIFQIRNIPDADMQAILAIACPNVLFPYGRETISDAVTRAGFPPLLLAPVNFEALYQQRQAQQQAESAAPVQ